MYNAFFLVEVGPLNDVVHRSQSFLFLASQSREFSTLTPPTRASASSFFSNTLLSFLLSLPPIDRIDKLHSPWIVKGR